ncbi:hypothetical protein GW17_00025576 [Ensete ventricosum]|nr:hypothetical protein GW17_00025576 [Ensete ventricosum]
MAGRDNDWQHGCKGAEGWKSDRGGSSVNAGCALLRSSAGAAEGGSYGYERRWQQLAGDDEEKEIKAAIEEGLAAVKKGLAAAEAVGKTRRQLCVVEEAGKRVAHWCGKGEGTGSGKWLACDEEEESNSGVARGQWQ